MNFKRILSFMLLLLILWVVVIPPKAIERSFFGYKSYTHNLIDGRTYKIKNVNTGTYMTLENNSISNSTRVVLNSYSGYSSQHFRLTYYGDNRYVLAPSSIVSKRLSISSTLSSTLVLNSNSYTNSAIRFTIKPINTFYYKIYTNASNNQNVLASEVSLLNGSYVKSAVDTNNSECYWEIEEVDEYYDSYLTFYYRVKNTNLFVTSIYQNNGSSLYVGDFVGNESQRFKEYPHDGANGGSRFSASMVKTDMGINLSSSLVCISNLSYTDGQGLTYTGDYDNGFIISSSYGISTKYIKIGTSTTINGEMYYYLITTSNSSEATIFIKEAAYFETAFINKLEENEVYTRSSNTYRAKYIYPFIPDHSGDYNFAYKKTQGSPQISLHETETDLLFSSAMTTSQAVDSYTLVKDKIYYLYIIDFSNTNSSSTFYMKSDLVVYIHGMNYGNFENARVALSIPLDYILKNYDYYDPVINTEADMNASFVQNIDPSTGLVPLQAPVYIFSGHGNHSLVSYFDYNSNETYLSVSDLYLFNTNTVMLDMSNCSLVIWLACKTAYSDKNNGYINIAKAAWKAGAHCSIGFSDNIAFFLSDYYIISFFNYVNQGYTISDALDYSYSFLSIFDGTESITVYGDDTQVIKPDMPNL